MESFVHHRLFSAVGSTLAAFGIITIGVIARLQPMPASADLQLSEIPKETLNQEKSLKQFPPIQETSTVPTTPQVAGAETTGLETNNSAFAVITASSPGVDTPPLGTASECTLGTLFSIGEREYSQASHPADELSWAEALDYLPEYNNPFVIGRDSAALFPWRTSAENTDTEAVQVQFSYSGPPVKAAVVLGWSPGKQGEKAKRVLVDSMEIGMTPMRTGTLTGGWWEHMARYEDEIPFVLMPGDHTMLLEHIATAEADAAIWDFVELQITDCE